MFRNEDGYIKIKVRPLLFMIFGFLALCGALNLSHIPPEAPPVWKNNMTTLAVILGDDETFGDAVKHICGDESQKQCWASAGLVASSRGIATYRTQQAIKAYLDESPLADQQYELTRKEVTLLGIQWAEFIKQFASHKSY